MQRIAVAMGIVSVLAILLLAGSPAMAKDWADHTGDVPFIVGFEKAKAEAEFSGKPMFAFFTTTW